MKILCTTLLLISFSKGFAQISDKLMESVKNQKVMKMGKETILSPEFIFNNVEGNIKIEPIGYIQVKYVPIEQEKLLIRCCRCTNFIFIDGIIVKNRIPMVLELKTIYLGGTPADISYSKPIVYGDVYYARQFSSL